MLRGLRNWLAGTLRGEISAAGLSGLRAAGAAAYSLVEEEGNELFRLCSWNAFALQTVADQLLDSDARFDPATAGRLPPATLTFAQECYTRALFWVDAARSARANPAYRPDAALPAELPVWPAWDLLRPVHIRCLQDAYEAIAPRAEYGLRDDDEAKLLAAAMHSAAEQAAAFGAHARSAPARGDVCEALLRALSAAFTLGQVSAMPSLGNVLQQRGHRGHPLSAIEVGWPVLDPSGTCVGTVARVEGDAALGRITGLLVSGNAFAADRHVDASEIQSVGAGFVQVA